MIFMATRRNVSTWRKIHELGNSDDEMDLAYAEILATAMDYRVKKGISQSELAKRSGLTISVISKIENQHSVPSVKNFLKYIRGLELDWAFIIKKDT